MKKYHVRGVLMLIVGFALATSVSANINTQRGGSSYRVGDTMVMVASYYGRDDGFHNRRTANCETMDWRSLTAAHKSLPFGTRLRITNNKLDRSITVRINNRGPYVRGRDIDLSTRAAEVLGIQKAGVAKIEVEVVYVPTKDDIEMGVCRK